MNGNSTNSSKKGDFLSLLHGQAELVQHLLVTPDNSVIPKCHVDAIQDDINIYLELYLQISLYLPHNSPKIIGFSKVYHHQVS